MLIQKYLQQYFNDIHINQINMIVNLYLRLADPSMLCYYKLYIYNK